MKRFLSQATVVENEKRERRLRQIQASLNLPLMRRNYGWTDEEYDMIVASLGLTEMVAEVAAHGES